MPLRIEEKIVFLDGQIMARENWLDTHGGKVKWPEYDLDLKRRGLEMLIDIRDDYQKSLDRSKAKDG